MNDKPWYVAVDDVIRGPAATELVIKGIEHRKVPPEAMVCEVGTARWVPLASVEAFHATVIRSYPPPPPGSAEEHQWMEYGFRFPSPAALPRFDDDLEVEPETARPALASMPEIDVELVDSPAIDWSAPFESYFLLGEGVALPDERALLDSLSIASRETFRHEEALWNLALCLAYGSDELGVAAARAFFDAVADQGSSERLDWMSRTLRGEGFVPSGIPAAAGLRAVERLRSSCPPAWSAKLS